MCDGAEQCSGNLPPNPSRLCSTVSTTTIRVMGWWKSSDVIVSNENRVGLLAEKSDGGSVNVELVDCWVPIETTMFILLLVPVVVGGDLTDGELLLFVVFEWNDMGELGGEGIGVVEERRIEAGEEGLDMDADEIEDA